MKTKHMYVRNISKTDGQSKFWIHLPFKFYISIKRLLYWLMCQNIWKGKTNDILLNHMATTPIQTENVYMYKANLQHEKLLKCSIIRLRGDMFG